MNQKASQQLALDAEKIFSSESLLLVTFHEQELNRSVIKQLHSDIKNVHILHPIFIPKRRCIIEIEKKSDINMIKSALNKKQYDTAGYITVDFIKNYKETNKNIDPCTLYVRNLPANVTNRDIEILYPACMKYKFLSSLENSKAVLVHFHNAEDAVIAYKSTNNIFYQSNLLMVQFHRRGLKVNPLVSDNETIEIDDEFDDELKEDDVDHDSSDEDTYIDDEFTNSDDFDYDDFAPGTHSGNSQENNNVTDTLHVQNLPSNITDDELLDLYPNCHEYRFLPLKCSRAKSALLRFHSIKDASVAHSDTSNIVYKSHTLYVQFYRKHNDAYPSSNDAEVINLDVSEDENECSIINDEVAEETNSGIRGENISQKKAKVNNKSNVRPGRPAEVENVKKQADGGQENTDPQVLHVENLPFIVTGEDLVKLYPACREYQIIRDKSQTSVSALIYFNTVHDANEAYNATSNTMYKSRMLSIKFRCKTLNINPLAVMKRKTNHFHENKDFNNSSSSSSSSKKLKKSACDNRRRNSTDEEDVILVGQQAQKTGQMEEMKEDDVEYKSEEEEYTDDFGVDPEIDNDDYEEDAIEDDEDQDMELDENDTFLPHDEDDE